MVADVSTLNARRANYTRCLQLNGIQLIFPQIKRFVKLVTEQRNMYVDHNWKSNGMAGWLTCPS
jgi:hypothetical protein